MTKAEAITLFLGGGAFLKLMEGVAGSGGVGRVIFIWGQLSSSSPVFFF